MKKTPEEIKKYKEKIKKYKEQYGDIFLIEVEGKSAIVKKPGRKELSMATTTSQSDPIVFNELILSSCWLEGDQEIQTNDDLFLAVAAQLDSIIEVADATVKKL